MKPDASFRLYLITDRKMCAEEEFLPRLEAALHTGIKAIQLREKDLSSRALLELAGKLRKRTHHHHAKLFINDRLDVALSADADGLHCPEDGPPVQTARTFLGTLPEVSPNPRDISGSVPLIGRSVHSLKGARKAEQDGADFITFSPIFETASKQGVLQPQGLAALEQVTSSMKIPVFALGGITPERAEKCREAGAWGVAVISAVLKSTNIPETIERFKRALGEL